MLHPFLLALALAPVSVPVADDSGKSEAPSFRTASGDGAASAMPLTLVQSHTDVEIAGVGAEITLRQTWHNVSAHMMSADYIFPAPVGAAVQGMHFQIGERGIEAKIQERGAAAATYAHAVAQGQSAALLEQERPNVFRMRVGNIPPGEVIEVTLRYVERLRHHDGEYQLVLPRSVGSRYREANPAQQSAPLPRGTPPSVDCSVDVVLRTPLPLGDITSPSHRIEVEKVGATEAWIRWRRDADAPSSGERDLVMRYRLRYGGVAEGVMLYRDPDDGENYFMLTLAPPPHIDTATTAPREVILVVDVSGSMTGEPLAVAQRAVRRLLDALGPADRFNVLTFSGASARWRPTSATATAAHQRDAFRFLKQARAGGGTRLQDAIKRAEALPGRRPGVARALVVITDGQIHADQALIHHLYHHRNDFTVFALGVGRHPNRYLIDGLARAGGGEAFVVATQKDADAVAERLALAAARPALTDIKLRFHGFDAYDLAPSTVGDLYADRPMVVLGKYRGPARGTVFVDAKRGTHRHRGVVAIEDNAEKRSHRVLGALWARERIADRVDFKAPEANHRAEVLALGLKHQLLTPWTSLVAVDPKVRDAIPVTPPSTSETYGVGGLGISGIGVGGSGRGLALGSGGLIDFGGRGGASVHVGEAVVTGSLARASILRVLRRSQNRFRFCYEKSLVKQPDQAGALSLRFAIAANGHVAAVTVSQSELAPEVSQCVRNVVLRLRFPKPAGGGQVAVTYPLRFAPK